MRTTLGLALAVCLVASLAQAEPRPSGLPEALQTLRGSMEVVSDEFSVSVTMLGRGRAGAVLFRVETAVPVGLPDSFSVDSGEVYYWQGHLLLLDSLEKKAFHFTIPDFRPPNRRAPQKALETITMAPDLGSVLAGYEVTRIDTATAISFASGPRAHLAIGGRGRILKTEPWPEENQDPNPSGNGSCGASCTMNCGDGSHCSVTCGPLRCASCSCPADCHCS